MKRERYLELEGDMKAKLTEAELAEGWFFCICEWDGMLVHKNWPEGKLCGCMRHTDIGESK